MSTRLQTRLPFWAGSVLTAVLLLSPEMVPPAVAKNWIAGDGNWNVPGNWSPASVPTAGEAVNIVFTDGIARTVTYNVSAPSLGLLSIDLTGPDATASTLSMPNNNSLSANGILVGGYNGVGVTSGRGAINQSAGTATTNPGWDFVLGHGAGSSGEYTLSGTGALVANQSQLIGLSGTGTFNHSAGTNTINANAIGSFFVGTNAGSTGTYNLSGTGTLTSFETEYVGFSGTGNFMQSGGTNSTSSALVVGKNVGSTGTYSMTAGLLSTAGEIIGESGTGTFNQDGGFNGIGYGLDVYLGYNAGATGTYNLNAGTLSSGHDVYVGFGGSGTVNQSGGTHSVQQNFVLGYSAGSTGTYNLTAGSLDANQFSSYSTSVGLSGTGIFDQWGGTSNFGANGIAVGSGIGGSGTYTLNGGSTTATSVHVGGSASGSGGTGVFNVGNSGVLTVSGTLKAYNTPGTMVNLSSGGRINTAALDFSGLPALLNWTGGTLNLTSNVILESSGAFGPDLAVGSGQTFMVTGNETLGGTGPFSLSLGGSGKHHVTGTLTLAPTGTIFQNTGSTLYAATIIQAGGTVSGTLQNQGNFVYQSGPFYGRLLNQGTVSLGPSFTAGNGVANEGMLTLNAGQTLTVNGAGLDNLGTFTLAGGVISGNGPVVNNFGGTLQAHGTINPTFTNNGLLDVDGVLRLNGASATNNGIVRGSGTVIGTFANAAGGTLELAAGNLLAISSPWTSSGLVTVESGAVLGGGSITNTGTIQGAGTINSPILNSGVVRASGGQLNLGAAGNTNPAAGLIQASTGNTLMVLRGLPTNNGTIGLTGGAFDNNNHALANSGIINGYGVIRTSALTNTNKLNVGEGNMDVFGSVTNNGTIGIQGGRSIYFFGNVTGSGSFTGTGTAVFLAAVSPGSSPAAVSFGGNATLASSSSLNIELGGLTPGNQYDRLLVSGALALGGELDVSFINGFTPLAGQSFDILDWGSISGTFSSLNLPTLAGLGWNTSQLYTTGVLSLAAAGLPGDYNQNNVIDAADYTVWRDNLGSGTALPNDDTAGVGPDDYTRWKTNFGQTAGSGSSSAFPLPPSALDSAVPEPSAAILLVLSLPPWLLRRKRASAGLIRLRAGGASLSAVLSRAGNTE